MQTAEVLQRDIITHYVTAQEGKQIVWNFTVRKKTINFGLYLHRNAKSNKSSPRLTPQDSNGSLKSASSPKGTPSKSKEEKDYFDSARSGREGTPDTNDGEHSGSHGRRKSTSMAGGAVSLLTDPNYVEIIPIENYEADKDHKGSYNVKESGRYCLVFDNTFSRNTSKMVTFVATVQDKSATDQDEKVDLEGWLLKKRRKKMQGWARRWFTINDGTLTYRMFPNSPSRGSIEIGLAAIASNVSQNSIHIDSGQQIWHLRTLTKADFDKWMAQFRIHLNTAAEQQFDEFHSDGVSSPASAHSRGRSGHYHAKRRSFAPSDSKSEVPKLYGVLGAMDKQFREIKELLDMLKQQSKGQGGQGAQKNFEKQANEAKERIKSAFDRLRGNEGGNGTPAPSEEKKALLPLDQLHDQLYSHFVQLKNEKEQAFELLRNEVDRWKVLDLQYRSMTSDSREASAVSSPLSALPSTPGDLLTGVGNLTLNTAGTVLSKVGLISEDSVPDVVKNSPRDVSPAQRTYSFASSRSSLFFDAEEIALSGDYSSDEEDGESPIVEEDEDEEEPEDEAETTDTSVEEDKNDKEKVNEKPNVDVKRRDQLPHPVAGDDVSLFSILRKNVGKDLSTISMPVSLNEPLSVLQRMAEELEYSEVLDKAAEAKDSLERLMYVAAFAISGYSSTQNRAGRKPFNPLLGETYELVRPDKGFKFIAEKVVHRPPIMAGHADSAKWEFYQDSQAKNKFWGKSMEIIPDGTTHVILKETKDHFTYNRPSTWMRNMMAGTKYLEHTGTMTVTNETTKEKCEITFQESSMWSKERNQIEGIVYDSKGKKTNHKIQGKWSESVYRELEQKDQYAVLWRVNQFPKNCEKYYGFSKFAVELNEVTPEIKDKLAPTDARLRPDQKALEEGDVAKADEEKKRVEQKQRETRQKLESSGKEHEASYFKKDNKGQWVSKGNYWEQREKGEWKDALEIF